MHMVNAIEAEREKERTPLVKFGVLVGRGIVMVFLGLTSLSWFAALLTQDPVVYSLAIYLLGFSIILFAVAAIVGHVSSKVLD